MKRRYYYRRIIIALTIMAAIIISIAFSFQLYGQIENITNDITKTNLSRAEESARIIDEKLSISLKVFTRISEDSEIEEYFKMHTFDPKIVLQAQKTINAYTGIMPNVEARYYIFNKQTDEVVSNIYTSSIDSFYDYYNINENDEIYIYISDNDFSYANKMRVFEIGNEIHFVIKDNDRNISNAIIMAIPKVSLLSHSLKTDNDFEFLISVSDKTTSSSIESSIGSYIHYEYKYSYDSINIWENIFNNMFAILILIIVACALIFISSKAIYAPMRRLINTTSDEEDGDIAEVKDEFELIKLHIDRVKNHTSTQVSNSSLLLKELILGYQRDNLIQVLTNNDIHLSDKNFYFIYVIPRATDSLQHYLSAQIIKHSLKNICVKHNFDIEFYVIKMADERFVIFINNSARAEMMGALQNLPLSFDDYRMILSKTASFATISKRYKKLNEMTKSKTILNIDTVLLEEELDLQDINTFSFSDNSKKSLMFNIGRKNKIAFMQTIQDEIVVAIDNPNLTSDGRRILFETIDETVNEMIPSYGLTGDVYEILLSAKNDEELKHLITIMFLDCYNIINEENDKNDTKQKLINYIAENYDKDISLNDMAEHFNLSSNYIGILFKEKTGDNFKAFLNSYRINVAQQILLETPNIKIKDLALAVGFANTNTFIRIFKEKEGMSPGQYQKLNINQ